MKTAKFRTSIRPGALLQMAALLTLAPLLSLPEAAAFAPQDSTHLDFTFQRQPSETTWFFPRMINERVYYAGGSGTGSPIRARNSAGELVFEYSDPQTSTNMDYALSADGRLYHYINTAQQYQHRLSIVAPNGTKIRDFGPNGTGAGTFSSGHPAFGTPSIAVSPATGRIYVSDEATGSGFDPAKQGLIRVFDREGNYLNQFRTNGILASTLEGFITQLAVRGDAQGQDELYVVDTGANFKVFGGDGQFRRLVTGDIFDGSDGYINALNSMVIWQDRLIFSQHAGSYYLIKVFPATVSNGSEVQSVFGMPNHVLGVHDSGGFIVGSGGQGGETLSVYSYPNFSNFDAVKRNAVPNPWVLGVTQRPGSGIVDIDYRVDDKNDLQVTTALVAFANGVANLTNVLPLNTLTEGTGSRVGPAQPTGTIQRVTWNAGTDWNVDFGTLRVMALARDSRTQWFDTHLVEIPADGVRPAVTISRNPLREDDFLAQFLWLVATKDPSVELTGGVLFGTTGADDGVILANGATSTVAGRTFLLKRDGLRIATAAEVTRAREGATPGFEVKLTPPLQMARTHPAGTFPNQINEFGIETGNIGTAWYVVREESAQ